MIYNLVAYIHVLLRIVLHRLVDRGRSQYGKGKGNPREERKYLQLDISIGDLRKRIKNQNLIINSTRHFDNDIHY